MDSESLGNYIEMFPPFYENLTLTKIKVSLRVGKTHLSPESKLKRQEFAEAPCQKGVESKET